MGALSLPRSGAVYVDANSIIYAVEKIKPYDEVLAPLWVAAVAGQLAVFSSEIVVLECLVKPIRDKNARLENAFRSFLLESAEFDLAPIDLRIVEQAAHPCSDRPESAGCHSRGNGARCVRRARRYKRRRFSTRSGPARCDPFRDRKCLTLA